MFYVFHFCFVHFWYIAQCTNMTLAHHTEDTSENVNYIENNCHTKHAGMIETGKICLMPPIMWSNAIVLREHDSGSLYKSSLGAGQKPLGRAMQTSMKWRSQLNPTLLTLNIEQAKKTFSVSCIFTCDVAIRPDLQNFNICSLLRKSLWKTNMNEVQVMIQDPRLSVSTKL